MNKKEQSFYDAQKNFSKKGLLPDQKKAMLSDIYKKVPIKKPIHTEPNTPLIHSVISPFFICLKKTNLR